MCAGAVAVWFDPKVPCRLVMSAFECPYVHVQQGIYSNTVLGHVTVML